MATSTGSRLATALPSSRMIRGAGTSATKTAVLYAWNPGSRSRLRRLLSVPEPEAAGPLPWDAGVRQRGRDRATLTRPGDRGDLRGARDRIRPRAIAHGTWVWLPRHFPNQSTACQPDTSSGPLTTTANAAAASNLSSGSGVIIVFLFTDPPDHVSAVSGPGIKPAVRPVPPRRPLEGLALLPRFPAAFPPLAFAFWSSYSRRGVELSSRSADRTRRIRTPTGFPRFARTSNNRDGRPLYPGQRCSP